MDEKRNYYEVLEVPVNATLQEIHYAYVKMKNAYAGDSVAMYSLMSQEDCNAILEQIEQAYSVIGSPDKRREYDKVKGLNQGMTPEGFNQELNSRPEYKPKRGDFDLMEQTRKDMESASEQQRPDEQEFVYGREREQENRAIISKTQAFQKFGLNHEVDTAFEQEIENCSDYTGAFLKKIREYKNVTIERMADMTKISKTYIRNIEEDEHSKLPARVYTRGFVYQYAKCLKLNPDLVATSYMRHLQQIKSGDKE